MNWISVNDKLPQTWEQHNTVYSSGKLLVYADEGCEIDEYLSYVDNHKPSKWLSAQNVTHWMELPSNPINENNN